jgi:hypothetical protein
MSHTQSDYCKFRECHLTIPMNLGLTSHKSKIEISYRQDHFNLHFPNYHLT